MNNGFGRDEAKILYKLTRLGSGNMPIPLLTTSSKGSQNTNEEMSEKRFPSSSKETFYMLNQPPMEDRFRSTSKGKKK